MIGFLFFSIHVFTWGSDKIKELGINDVTDVIKVVPALLSGFNQLPVFIYTGVNAIQYGFLTVFCDGKFRILDD